MSKYKIFMTLAIGFVIFVIALTIYEVMTAQTPHCLFCYK